MSILSPDRAKEVALRGAVTPLWARHYINNSLFETANPSTVTGTGIAGSLVGSLIGTLIAKQITHSGAGRIIGGLLGAGLGGYAGTYAGYKVSRD